MGSRRGAPHVAVIGLGDLGQSVAFALVDRGAHVLGIDRNTRRIDHLQHKLNCIALDATDQQALLQSGIGDYTGAVVAIENDLESSVLATVALKNLGVRIVVATSALEHGRGALLRVGADRVLEPQSAAAARLAFELTYPGATDSLRLSPDHYLVAMQAPHALIGHFLSTFSSYADQEQLTVLAIQRGEQTLLFPSGNTTLLTGDLLLILGKQQAIEAISDP
ncbi:MAG: potassium channel family protein [Chloroflexota bacterium]